MSLVYLGTRELPGAPTEDGPSKLRGGTSRSSKDPLAESLSAITGYLPAESVALYTACLGFVQVDPPGEARTLKWVVAGVCLFLSLALVAVLRRRKCRRSKPQQTFKIPWADLGVTMFAFSIYAVAMPGSAAWTYDGFTGTMAGLIAAVGHFVLGLIAIARE